MGHPSQTEGAKRHRARRVRAPPLGYSLVDSPDPSRAPRPCACCGMVFQPSLQRRMLCSSCWHKAPGPYIEPATIGSMKS